MITIYVTVAGNSPVAREVPEGTTVANVLANEGHPSTATVTLAGETVADKSVEITDGQNLFITRDNKQGL